MKNKLVYALWGALYIVCALLGFVNAPAGFVKILMVFLSLVFFLPGGVLLFRAIRENDTKTRRTVRLISALSLLLTLLMLIANFFAVLASETVGNLLHALLVLVSAPMLCSQYWVLSMFLWACLLMGSFVKPKK